MDRQSFKPRKQNVKGDEGPSAGQMALHTKQRDSQVRPRAGQMEDRDKRFGRLDDGTGEGGAAGDRQG